MDADPGSWMMDTPVYSAHPTKQNPDASVCEDLNKTKNLFTMVRAAKVWRKDIGRKKKGISSKLKKKECNRFVLKTPDTKDPKNRVCGCGQIYGGHRQQALENCDLLGTALWAPATDTVEMRTDAFGQTEFVGFSQRLANYVRVSDETSMDTILDMLLYEWRLEPPNLLISVTGGVDNFTMKPRLKETFRRGIIKAAQSTGAWITTGGTNAGVMKQVGEAIRDHAIGSSKSKRVVCLGITPWSSTCNKQSLVNANGNLRVSYDVVEPTRNGEIAIEPNHSHFILVDDGTSYKFGGEVKFRGKLEAALSKWKLTKAEQLKKELGRAIVPVKIPLVIVVLEGGSDTIGTVYDGVLNGTPVVFAEGSRGAADVFAYALSKCRIEEETGIDAKGEEKKITRIVMQAGLREKIEKLVEDNWSDKDIAKLTDQVIGCLEKIELLNVFRLDSSESAKDIDVTILQALPKANKEAHIEQLQLALAWNRIDIAKTDIFTEGKKWKTGELDKVMHQALVDNRTEFVSAFMENGVSLKLFVTRQSLLSLYSEIPKTTLLHSLLQMKKGKNKPLRLCDIGNLLQELIGEFYEPTYLQSQYHEELLEKSGDIPEDHFPTPSCELFIWAVLMNRREMAHLFWVYWEEGKESVAAALTASNILKNLATKAAENELQTDILQHAKIYEDHAIGVLDELLTANEELAHRLLIRVNKNFGDTTSLQLAVEADNQIFLSHSCCQSLLTSIWYGKLSMNNPIWRILLSLIFPPLLFVLLDFREDDEQSIQDVKNAKIAKNAKQARPEGEKDSIDVEAGVDSEGNRSIGRKPSVGASSNDSYAAPSPSPVPVLPSQKRRDFHPIDRMLHFFEAPIITFAYNCFSYLVFLTLFSYIMIQSMTLYHFSAAEYVLCIWILSFILEETHQIISDEAKRASDKFARYISDAWNKLDVIVIIIYISGLALRCMPLLFSSKHNSSATDVSINLTAANMTTTMPTTMMTTTSVTHGVASESHSALGQEEHILAGNLDEQYFLAARILLSFDLMIFYFRIFHICSVLRALGPKIVMMAAMMKDVFFFSLLLGTIMFAYGVTSQAILYEKNVVINSQLVKNIVYKVFWQFFGVARFEDLKDGYCLPEDTTMCPIHEGQQVSQLMMAAFTFLTNILLLNLLIALFEYTMDSVQLESDMVWMYQRFFFISEYYEKSVLAPPFIILNHIYTFVRFLIRKCLCMEDPDDDDENNGFRLVPSDEESREWTKLEAICADEYIRKSKGGATLTESQGRVMVTERIVEYREQFGGLKDSHTATMEDLGKKLTSLDSRIIDFEEKIIHMTSALRYVVECMCDPKKTSTLPLPDVPDYRARVDEDKRRRENDTAH